MWGGKAILKSIPALHTKIRNKFTNYYALPVFFLLLFSICIKSCFYFFTIIITKFVFNNFNGIRLAEEEEFPRPMAVAMASLFADAFE